MKLQFIQRYHADVEVGAKLTLDGAPAVKTMKEFKQEIKSANEELLNTSARFGATSKEALAAAKRVAELKDNIADANETAKLFDPGNKFQVLGNAVRGLVGGFTALQGALALVGVEGDEVQKTLLKVQGALALTEGLNVIADVTKDFQRLGSVLVQTLGKSGLIGVAIAGVAALTAVFIASRNANADLTAAQKEFNKSAVEANLEVAKMKNIFAQAEKGIISKEKALEEYNSGIGQTVGQTKSLNEAEKLLADNADEYVKVQGLKAKANFLLQKSAELSAQAEIARLQLAQSGFANIDYVSNALEAKFKKAEDDSKKYLDLVNTINNEIAATSTGFKVAPTAPPPAAAPPKTKPVIEAEAELEAIKAIDAEMFANKESYSQRTKDLYNSLNENLKVSNRSAADDDIEQKRRQGEAAMQLRDLEASMAHDRIVAAQSVGNALGALADLVGKQTAAGKALAVAQAVINTWVGVSEVLSAKSVLPEPIATISKIANVAAIVATGIVAVKNILKTKVPGGSGGGGGASVGSLQSSAPIRPQAPAATNTLLNQQQLNQIGNAASRSFVLEADVSSNQERVRRLNRAARI